MHNCLDINVIVSYNLKFKKKFSGQFQEPLIKIKGSGSYGPQKS